MCNYIIYCTEYMFARPFKSVPSPETVFFFSWIWLLARFFSFASLPNDQIGFDSDSLWPSTSSSWKHNSPCPPTTTDPQTDGVTRTKTKAENSVFFFLSQHWDWNIYPNISWGTLIFLHHLLGAYLSHDWSLFWVFLPFFSILWIFFIVFHQIWFPKTLLSVFMDLLVLIQ